MKGLFFFRLKYFYNRVIITLFVVGKKLYKNICNHETSD